MHPENWITYQLRRLRLVTEREMLVLRHLSHPPWIIPILWLAIFYLVIIASSIQTWTCWCLRERGWLLYALYGQNYTLTAATWPRYNLEARLPLHNGALLSAFKLNYGEIRWNRNNKKKNGITTRLTIYYRKYLAVFRIGVGLAPWGPLLCTACPSSFHK